MARNKKTLLDYVLKNIENNESKKVKGVIGIIEKPEDFSTILTILAGREDKNFSSKVDYYESLFERFLLISDLFNPTKLKKKDWHSWTVIFSEMSNILWGCRNNFNPLIWINAINKIYEISFETMGRVEPNNSSDTSECGNCSKLFSNLFSHLSEHASTDDLSRLKLPSLDKIIDIYQKQVKVDWTNCHYRSVIESKFFPLENTM